MKFHSLLSTLLLTAVMISAGCSDQGNQKASMPDDNDQINHETNSGASSSGNTENANSSSTENRRMSTSFEAHQSVARWLESVRGETLRVPVVINADGLGIDSAFLCSSVGAESEGQPLRLDDSALGIPLTDSIRNLVDQKTGKCFVWLEGKSGTLLSPSSATDSAKIKADEPHDFTVFKFLGSVEKPPAVPGLSR